MSEQKEWTLIESEKFSCTTYIVESKHANAVDSTMREWERKGMKPVKTVLIEHSAYAEQSELNRKLAEKNKDLEKELRYERSRNKVF